MKNRSVKNIVICECKANSPLGNQLQSKQNLSTILEKIVVWEPIIHQTNTNSEFVTCSILWQISEPTLNFLDAAIGQGVLRSCPLPHLVAQNSLLGGHHSKNIILVACEGQFTYVISVLHQWISELFFTEDFSTNQFSIFLIKETWTQTLLHQWLSCLKIILTVIMVKLTIEQSYAMDNSGRSMGNFRCTGVTFYQRNVRAFIIHVFQSSLLFSCEIKIFYMPSFSFSMWKTK